VKRAAAAAALASGDDVEAVGVDAAVYARVVAASRELLAACQRAHPDDVIVFYVGSARLHRVDEEAYAWACRSREPLVATLAGKRLTAAQLRGAGFKSQTLYESRNALNVDSVEATVQKSLRPDVGSLWRVTGAGGQIQGGPGYEAAVFITYGPLPPGCTCAPRAVSFWPEGHGVPQRAAAGAAASQPPPPSRHATQASIASFFTPPPPKKRKLT
jgi:hypothetical protein